MENWRRYVNEGKSLFSHVKSGRNMDIYQNYPDTYNIYLDWVLYDKKDSAAKAYVEHFREMASMKKKKVNPHTGKTMVIFGWLNQTLWITSIPRILLIQ